MSFYGNPGRPVPLIICAEDGMILYRNHSALLSARFSAPDNISALLAPGEAERIFSGKLPAGTPQRVRAEGCVYCVRRNLRGNDCFAFAFMPAEVPDGSGNDAFSRCAELAALLGTGDCSKRRVLCGITGAVMAWKNAVYTACGTEIALSVRPEGGSDYRVQMREGPFDSALSVCASFMRKHSPDGGVSVILECGKAASRVTMTATAEAALSLSSPEAVFINALCGLLLESAGADFSLGISGGKVTACATFLTVLPSLLGLKAGNSGRSAACAALAAELF